MSQENNNTSSDRPPLRAIGAAVLVVVLIAGLAFFILGGGGGNTTEQSAPPIASAAFNVSETDMIDTTADFEQNPDTQTYSATVQLVTAPRADSLTIETNDTDSTTQILPNGQSQDYNPTINQPTLEELGDSTTITKLTQGDEIIVKATNGNNTQTIQTYIIPNGS